MVLCADGEEVTSLFRTQLLMDLIVCELANCSNSGEIDGS